MEGNEQADSDTRIALGACDPAQRSVWAAFPIWTSLLRTRRQATCLAQFITAAARATAIAFLNILWNNFAPRFGVAYRLTNQDRHPWRAGIFNSNYINQGLGLPAFGYSTTASFCVGRLRHDSGLQLGQRIPAELPPPAGHRSDRREPPGRNGRLPDQYRLPYKIQWNFLVEHQFASDLSMSFAYVAQCWTAPVRIAEHQPVAASSMRRLPLSLLTSRVDSPAAQAAGYREPFPGFISVVGSTGNRRAGTASVSAVCRRSIYGSTYGNSNYQSFQYKLDKRYAAV